MKQAKFYRSPISGEVMLKMSGPYMDQLGDGLIELRPNDVTQAATDYHIPSVRQDGRRLNVRVGESTHPMSEEHYIQWIYLHAAMGGQFRALQPGAPAEAEFSVTDDRVYGVYAYCNLHGLWMWDAEQG